MVERPTNMRETLDRIKPNILKMVRKDSLALRMLWLALGLTGVRLNGAVALVNYPGNAFI